jgi:uncharacterized protein YggE
MINKLLLSLFVGLLFIGGIAYFAGTANAADGDNQTTSIPDTEINVYGTASIEMDPDLAILNLGVKTDSENANDAAQLNAQQISQIIDALKDSGISEEDISTSYYSLQPNYEWNDEYTERTLVGYTVTHTLSVKVQNPDDVGEVVDIAVTAGANEVDSIRFTLKDETIDRVRTDLIKEAVLKARNDANVVADALDHSIVGVKTMSTGDSYVPYQYNYPTVYEFKADALSTSIIPGQVSVSASVSATYLSEPTGALIDRCNTGLN